MPDGIFRFRLDKSSREVLVEVLREAANGETSLSREWLMLKLADQFENPRPGRPIVLNMQTMSVIYYRNTGNHKTIREKKALGKCEDCGLAIPEILEVDHIDADRSNNAWENLRLCCPNCHKLKALRKRQEAARILGVPLENVQAW